MRPCAAADDTALRASPYKVLEMWRDFYGGNLLIVLPDTFGTAAFLAKAPDWVADWTGMRPDSKPIMEAGEEIIAWYRARGRDPREKLIIFSDGLDIDSIEAAHRAFIGRIRISYGWGTNLTNDFRGCASRPMPLARPDLAGLQDHRGQRPAGGQDLGQSRQGDRRAARARALSRIFGEKGRVEQAVTV